MTDKIITVSNYSRKDIVETLGIPPEKVETIYASADSMFKPISDRSRLEPIRRKFNITGKLIFNLSADYPNKNVKNLILAFSDLSRLEKRRLQLIIAGKRESEKGSDEINQLLDRVPYHENIQWLTHLPDEELILLYNLADVFVFPSLHEGFGLPVLEAMACGTPVVASNATSIPEVAGDAALSVNARNVDEITRAIREILFNIELRQTLVEKGFKQAASFGWERTAVQTQAVYDKVCREVPPRRIEDLPDAMKHWLNRHLAVAAGMEEEIIYLTETINRIDTRLARLRASVPGRIYGALRRLKK